MKTLLRPLALLCLPALPPSLAQAAFSPAVVASDSRWVIHVDFNTLRETEPGKKALADFTEAQSQMTQNKVKLDLQKVLGTLGSVTAYGSNFSQDPHAIDGTLVIEGTPELRTIAEGWAAEASINTPQRVTEIKDMPFDAYSFGGDMMVAFPKEQVILVSKSKQHLQRAYEVYRGKAPSLKSAPSDLSALIPKDRGAYLMAASLLPSEEVFAKNAPQTRILRLAHSVAIALGETDKKTFLHVDLNAPSNDTAEKLMKIVQGMTAMLSLAETSDKQLEEFARSVTVNRRDNSVRVSLSYSSERIIRMVESFGVNYQRTSSPAEKGKTIATWEADQQLAEGQPLGAEMFATQTVENVQLTNGTTLILSVGHKEGDPGRIDYVEITSQQPSAAPLRFEAEFMRLTGFRVETATYASGGKIALLKSHGGSARLSFPGAPGLYTVSVRYLDDPAGKATFTLVTRDPEPVPNE